MGLLNITDVLNDINHIRVHQKANIDEILNIFKNDIRFQCISLDKYDGKISSFAKAIVIYAEQIRGENSEVILKGFKNFCDFTEMVYDIYENHKKSIIIIEKIFDDDRLPKDSLIGDAFKNPSRLPTAYILMSKCVIWIDKDTNAKLIKHSKYQNQELGIY